jgi:hypothetical protein
VLTGLVFHGFHGALAEVRVEARRLCPAQRTPHSSAHNHTATHTRRKTCWGRSLSLTRRCGPAWRRPGRQTRWVTRSTTRPSTRAWLSGGWLRVWWGGELNRTRGQCGQCTPWRVDGTGVPAVLIRA